MLLLALREGARAQSLAGVVAYAAALRIARFHTSTESGGHVLIAATRYVAAHAPTMRAERQTFHIARRLSRGERLEIGRASCRERVYVLV